MLLRAALNALPPATRPSAPTTSASTASQVGAPSPSSSPLPVGGLGRGLDVRGRRVVPALGGGELDLRRGLVGVRRPDPADDLAVAVGLERLERELVSGLSGTPTERPKSWNWPGPIRPSHPLAGPGDRVHPVGHLLAVSSVTGSASFFPSTFAVQPGTGSVDANCEARRGTGPRPCGRGVVALVRHAHVEPGEAPGRHLVGLQRHVGLGGGRRSQRGGGAGDGNGSSHWCSSLDGRRVGVSATRADGGGARPGQAGGQQGAAARQREAAPAPPAHSANAGGRPARRTARRARRHRRPGSARAPAARAEQRRGEVCQRLAGSDAARPERQDERRPARPGPCAAARAYEGPARARSPDRHLEPAE